MGKRLATALTTVALLAPVTSQAADLAGNPRIETARTIANAIYPQAEQRCGPNPPINAISLPSDRIAQARTGACMIDLQPTWRRWTTNTLCVVIVHEYGHLALLQFPDNPEDPDHSPDPHHVMYAGVDSTPREAPACGAIYRAQQQQRRKAASLRAARKALRAARKTSVRARWRKIVARRKAALQAARWHVTSVTTEAISDAQRGRPFKLDGL